jgi:hypothetical protein
MEEKKLVWLVEAEGREIIPTSWWRVLKGRVVVDLLSEARILNVRCWRIEAY